MFPSYLKVNDKVVFIPYTIDIPQLKIGRIEKDVHGKLFITYGDNFCDDGEWYICKVDEIKYSIDNINRKLNCATQELISKVKEIG